MSEVKTVKLDYVQVILVCSILSVLFYTVYLMNTNLTMISLAFAAFIMFYQLFSARGNLSSKFKYAKKIPSPFAIIMIVLPIVLASVASYESYSVWQSPNRVIILWGMTITFWSTMMFVPLAVYSKYKEEMLTEPLVLLRLYKKRNLQINFQIKNLGRSL